MAKTLVIAEPGCTHEGRKDLLVRLLETAHACGADAWKPQWTSDAVAMCERRHIGLDHPKRAYYEHAYRWLQFPLEWHAEFRQRCHDLGLQYACTVFLPQDVITIDPFVDAHKVASFEATDGLMRQAHETLNHQKEVWVSHGMQHEERSWNRPSWGSIRVRHFHCVSAYPAPLSELHLSVIHCVNDDESPNFDGYSDHSRHVRMGAYAVAAGAVRVETHYRLHACRPENPDYGVAFTPGEFAEYIRYIREADLALGDPRKHIQSCEHAMLPYRVLS